MELLSRKRHAPGQRLTKHVNCLSFDVGIKNLCYCLIEDVDEPDREFSIRLWENFSLKSESTSEAVFSLQRELDMRPWMVHCDHVCIESQTNMNPTMKVVSHAIQMYFCCRGAAPAEEADGVRVSHALPIHFISPRNKFKVCNVPDPSGPPGHAKNKKIAILMCKKILSSLQDKSMLEYLMSHRKKDDLSDSFLQGLYFLRMLRQRRSNSRRIAEHITEVTILEDRQEDIDGPTLYLGQNFEVPAFDIDGASVARSQVFRKA